MRRTLSMPVMEKSSPSKGQAAGSKGTPLSRMRSSSSSGVTEYTVTVTVPKESGIIVMPKPLYGFPVVRVLNAGLDGDETDVAESIEHPVFTGIRALVVDDEPMNLVVATGLLRDYGMEPDTAESGREALEKYDANMTY